MWIWACARASPEGIGAAQHTLSRAQIPGGHLSGGGAGYRLLPAAARCLGTDLLSTAPWPAFYELSAAACRCAVPQLTESLPGFACRMYGLAGE